MWIKIKAHNTFLTFYRIIIRLKVPNENTILNIYIISQPVTVYRNDDAAGTLQKNRRCAAGCGITLYIYTVWGREKTYKRH